MSERTTHRVEQHSITHKAGTEICKDKSELDSRSFDILAASIRGHLQHALARALPMSWYLTEQMNMKLLEIIQILEAEDRRLTALFNICLRSYWLHKKNEDSNKSAMERIKRCVSICQLFFEVHKEALKVERKMLDTLRNSTQNERNFKNKIQSAQATSAIEKKPVGDTFIFCSNSENTEWEMLHRLSAEAKSVITRSELTSAHSNEQLSGNSGSAVSSNPRISMEETANDQTQTAVCMMVRSIVQMNLVQSTCLFCLVALTVLLWVLYVKL